MDAPEIHPVHAHATYHRWFDYAIAASALFVSLVSLWVVIHHGRIMERLVQANSLPSIALNSDLVEDPITKALKLTLSLQNSGVGPARIESVELWRDAQPMTRPQDVLSGRCPAGC